MKPALWLVGAATATVGVWPLVGIGLGALAMVIAVVNAFGLKALAAEVHDALRDQAVGIQTVTEAAKAIGDDTNGG